MTNIDKLADFITQAHRTIELVSTPAEYSVALSVVTGAPEYRSIPDETVQDILHHLERKRNDVARRAYGVGAG